jgi:CDP-glycerol glycerophosphotransferase
MISKIRTILQIPFYRIVRIFSYLFPRNKNTWVFIGWHKNTDGEIFADNSKYLFLYASQQKEVKAIWIGKDKKISRELQKNGFSSYYLKTFAGIYYSLIAKYTIIDGLMQPENWMLAGNSKIIQLWHGKGMKKTGYDTPYSLPKYNRFLFPHLFVPFHKT